MSLSDKNIARGLSMKKNKPMIFGLNENDSDNKKDGDDDLLKITTTNFMFQHFIWKVQSCIIIVFGDIELNAPLL